MSDSNNGGPVHVSKILKEAAEALLRSDGKLLESWKDTHPVLRAVLLGAEFGGEKWSAGTLTVRRDGHEIVLSLRIDEYGLQAVYRDHELQELLDSIEFDLANRRVPWDKTYTEKQKDKSRIAAARKGS